MKIKKHEDYETIEVEYAEARDSQTIFLVLVGPVRVLGCWERHYENIIIDGGLISFE